MKHLLVYSVAIALIIANASALPVFPGAVGFGTDTRAAYGNGKNPVICIVDTLDATESLQDDTRNGIPVKTGGFKSCIDWAKDNKMIMFEVSGTITVNSRLLLDNNYITIAGHT